MKRMETVGICDLNAAVAAKDKTGSYCHTEICLLAQFAKRITGKKVTGSCRCAAQLKGEPKSYGFVVEGMADLVSLFDMGRYEEVRKQLPKLVVVDYQQ